MCEWIDQCASGMCLGVIKHFLHHFYDSDLTFWRDSWNCCIWSGCKQLIWLILKKKISKLFFQVFY